MSEVTLNTFVLSPDTDGEKQQKKRRKIFSLFSKITIAFVVGAVLSAGLIR